MASPLCGHPGASEEANQGCKQRADYLNSIVRWLGQYQLFRCKGIMQKKKLKQVCHRPRNFWRSKQTRAAMHCVSLTRSSGNIQLMWMQAPAFISAAEHTDVALPSSVHIYIPHLTTTPPPQIPQAMTRLAPLGILASCVSPRFRWRCSHLNPL